MIVQLSLFIMIPNIRHRSKTCQCLKEENLSQHLDADLLELNPQVTAFKMCNYTSFRGDQEMGIFACSLWSNPRGIEHQELFFFC